jgi:hypothetical protein
MSQTIIKGFPKLKSNPSKLKTFLSFVLVYAPFYTNVVEFFTVQSQVREWIFFEHINTNISASLPVGAKS